jgi:hypothetical protein
MKKLVVAQCSMGRCVVGLVAAVWLIGSGCGGESAGLPLDGEGGSDGNGGIDGAGGGDMGGTTGAGGDTGGAGGIIGGAGGGSVGGHAGSGGAGGGALGGRGGATGGTPGSGGVTGLGGVTGAGGVAGAGAGGTVDAGPPPTYNCPTTITGSIDVTDRTQTGRENRVTPSATCGAGKSFPGNMADMSNPHYADVYHFSNPTSSPLCFNFTLMYDTMGTSGTYDKYMTAYNSYDPANIANGYLADVGAMLTSPQTMGVTVPAQSAIDVVIFGVISGGGTGPYTLACDSGVGGATGSGGSGMGGATGSGGSGVGGATGTGGSGVGGSGVGGSGVGGSIVDGSAD